MQTSSSAVTFLTKVAFDRLEAQLTWFNHAEVKKKPGSIFSKLLPDPEEPMDGHEEEYSASNEPKPGTAEFIIQVEGRRSIKVALF